MDIQFDMRQPFLDLASSLFFVVVCVFLSEHVYVRAGIILNRTLADTTRKYESFHFFDFLSNRFKLELVVFITVKNNVECLHS